MTNRTKMPTDMQEFFGAFDRMKVRHEELIKTNPAYRDSYTSFKDTMDSLFPRCLVTGNPFGTDTWMEGHSCQCAVCQEQLRLRQ